MTCVFGAFLREVGGVAIMEQKRFDWGPVILFAVYLCGVGVGVSVADEEVVGINAPSSEYQVIIIEDGKITAAMLLDLSEVNCEFDPPLKHLTLIMHYYDTHEEMFEDYIVLNEELKPDENGEYKPIWGWSAWIWQPDDDWAAGDVYTVVPEYVRADTAMDTIGHETLHGSCGNFHE